MAPTRVLFVASWHIRVGTAARGAATVRGGTDRSTMGTVGMRRQQ
ncbi:MAG TPA: hypothetical protein VH333_04935 [Pseudonocardiaceae bacterium]|nr:hypothetical protein [Pseudonocardiaceae bacterium]